MEDFIYHNPTKIYFGKNAIENLESELLKYGKNILITYGFSSIKKNGMYDEVVNILKKLDKNIFEVNEIMPNPRSEKVYEGIELCKKEKIDFILAIGGGSVIDCSKAIALGARIDNDFWQEFFVEHKPAKDAIPLGTILSVAGTGSEMNCGFVITNYDTKQKLGHGDPQVYPKFSILNPEYTFSISRQQLINGSVDIFSHLNEVYFSKPDESNVSDAIVEGLMKNLIENVKVALINPKDYVARSNLMWISSMAINNIVELGKETDWKTHQIEHALSAFYDIAHGAGLSIITPHYFRYIYLDALDRFEKFALNVWNIDPTNKTQQQIALEGIEAFESFLKDINAITTLKEVNIPKDMISKMVASFKIYQNGYKILNDKDVEEILNNAYQEKTIEH